MKAPPFPVHLFPDPVRSFIIEGAAALDCDERFVGVPLTVASAVAVGLTRRLRLKRTWVEYLIIWAAMLGESGTMKSPAQRLAHKFLYRRQKQLLDVHAKAMAEYQSEIKAWKATPKGQRTEEPEKPAPAGHVVCTDVTTEALIDRLSTNPRGLGLMVDEFAGWMARFDRYSNSGGDNEHFLSMFNAEPIKQERKNPEQPTTFVPRAGVSICGGVQPGVMLDLMTQRMQANGTIARVLMVYPDPRPAKWSDREISDGTYNAMNALFDTWFAYSGEKDGRGEESPTDVTLDEQAQARFREYVDDHAVRAAKLTGPDAAFWSKLKAYSARFTLLFHCIRHGAGEGVSPFVADLDDVENGIALSDWFWEEKQRIFRSFRETDDERERRELMELVHRLGGRATPRQVVEHSSRYRRSEDAEIALRILETEGFGSFQTVKSGRRGRPSFIFCLADSPDFPAGDTPPEQVEIARTVETETDDTLEKFEGAGWEVRRAHAIATVGWKEKKNGNGRGAR